MKSQDAHTKWKVILYFAFGAVYATDNEQPDGDIRYFDTEREAIIYGRSKGVVFEPVEVKL